MNIKADWIGIRKHFNLSFTSNFHVSIASVDSQNIPTVTPIGSLFLNRDQTGFYFEKYPKKLPENLIGNKNICVLAVNSGRWFWIKSLFRGKFSAHPAIKLYGELGNRREATEIEISRLKRRMNTTRGFKGNKYLWGDMKYVRDILFTGAEMIHLGQMTKDLR